MIRIRGLMKSIKIIERSRDWSAYALVRVGRRREKTGIVVEGRKEARLA